MLIAFSFDTIEFDENKRREVLNKHGVDLLDAALVFESPVFVAQEQAVAGESRFKAFGRVDETSYVVVFTPRGRAARMITAWKAGRRDARRYQEALADRNPRDEKPG